MNPCRNHKVCLVLWLTAAQAVVIHAAVPALTLQRGVIFRGAAFDESQAPRVGREDANGPGPSLLLRDALDEEAPADEAGRRPTDRCRKFFAAYKATLPRGPLGFHVLDCTGTRAVLPTLRTVLIVSVGGRVPVPSRAFPSLTIGLCRARC